MKRYTIGLLSISMSLLFCQDKLSQMKTKVENDMYIDLFGGVNGSNYTELHNFNKIPSRGLKRSVKKYANGVKERDVILFNYDESAWGFPSYSFILTTDKLYNYISGTRNMKSTDNIKEKSITNLNEIRQFKWKEQNYYKDNYINVYGKNGEILTVLIVINPNQDERKLLIILLNDLLTEDLSLSENPCIDDEYLKMFNIMKKATAPDFRWIEETRPIFTFAKENSLEFKLKEKRCQLYNYHIEVINNYIFENMVVLDSLDNSVLIKSELFNMVQEFNKDLKIKYFTEEVQEAEHETVITRSYFDEDAYIKDLISYKLISGVTADDYTKQVLRSKHTKTNTSKKEVSPAQTIRKNKVVTFNKNVFSSTPKWEEVVKFYGGYSKVTAIGLTKKDTTKFKLTARIDNIELISPSECYVNIIVEGDSKYAMKYHQIVIRKSKYKGQYQIQEIGIDDIYNSNLIKVIFSFDNNKYMLAQEFSVSLAKLLGSSINMKELMEKYRNGMKGLLADFVPYDEFSKLDAIKKTPNNFQYKSILKSWMGFEQD